MKLIVYDLDGTLVDTRKDIAQAANQMRSQVGLSPLAESQIAGYVGLGLRQLVQNCLNGQDGELLDKGMAIYRAFYAEHLLDNTLLYPGARELLEHMKQKKQAMITNKPNPYSLQILQALGVAPYFAHVIAGDSGFAKKPDPASLLSIMQREGAAPQEAVFVGDSPIDIQTGRQAGVMTVAVSHGFCDRADLVKAQPDRLVEDLNEVLLLAKKESW